MSGLKRYRNHALLLGLLALSLAACSPSGGPAGDGGPTPTPTTQPPPVAQPTPASQATPSVLTREAAVDSVDVLILESFPVQIRAVVKGGLSDSCTNIGEIKQERDGNTFKIIVATTRPADAMCSQVIKPFEETVTLDVAGLKAGDYTVSVNGVSETFTLAADNVLP